MKILVQTVYITLVEQIFIYYVSSGLVKRGYTYFKAWDSSPNCRKSNCDLNIKTIYHQTFNTPVSFNEYVESNCGSSCGNKIPDFQTIKTKTFSVEFDIGKMGLDFYYLMDGTWTFLKDRKFLNTLAPEFVKTIQNLSHDSQIGYGLYTDKYGQPEFYGIHNKLSLTKNTSNFVSVVQSNITNGGRDYSEDSLTGIHQVAVCQSKINWRSNTLRMILVTTDEKFQKPTGNKKPYDRLCHLDANGIFTGTEYTDVDYPTEDDIKAVLKDNAIRVIFAIKELVNYTVSVTDTYRMLASKVSPQPIILKLEEDLKNIIQVVKDAYETATRSVVLETTLEGPKSIIDHAALAVKCHDDSIPDSGRSNEFSTLIDKTDCKVTTNGKVGFDIQVTLPCPLESKDVSLKVNAQGHAKWQLFDLNTVCN